MFGQRKQLRNVEVTPEKVGTAQSVTAQISELTVLRAVAAVTRSRAGIDCRDESVRIEPLNRTRLGHAGNRIVFIQGYARNDAGELRSSALHDAISICGVRCAEDSEW